MRRVLRDAPALLTVDVVDGTGETLATDITAATLDLTASDGATALPGSPFTVTDGFATGQLTFEVPATSFVDLDVIDVAWTVTRPGGDQTIRDQLEIVGGFLYTARQLRARYPELASPDDFTADRIRENREQIDDVFANCDVSFVARARRASYQGIWSTLLPLDDLAILTVREILIDGTALTVDELADVTVLHDTGHLIRSAGWCNGTRKTVEVLYEHGLTSVPDDVHRAAMTLARATLTDPAAPSRATSLSTETGSFRLSTAGRDGLTGFPDVDATLARWGAGGTLVAL